MSFYLLNYFDGNTDLVDGSTLTRSSNIFAYYDSFWFGSGAYSSGLFLQGISSLTDLTLAFIFVEFGVFILFGSLFLFLYPLFRCFLDHGYCLSSQILFLLFVSVLFQTVTDQGFFTNYSSYLYFLFAGFLLINKF